MFIALWEQLRIERTGRLFDRMAEIAEKKYNNKMLFILKEALDEVAYIPNPNCSFSIRQFVIFLSNRGNISWVKVQSDRRFNMNCKKQSGAGKDFLWKECLWRLQ